jgi:hypothetical protein
VILRYRYAENCYQVHTSIITHPLIEKRVLNARFVARVTILSRLSRQSTRMDGISRVENALRLPQSKTEEHGSRGQAYCFPVYATLCG